MRALGAIVLVAASLGASAAFAGDPRVDYFYSGSFTAIGDAPNISWTTGLNGAINPVATAGVPNVLVSYTDNRGHTVTDAPATLAVSGAFFSAAGLATPYARMTFSFTYDGPPGTSFTLDCPLFEGGNLGNGSCAEGVNNFAFDNIVNYWVTPGPEETFVVNGSGAYPFTLAGSGQVSGTFSGGGAPEPATWALLIAGFGGVGAALRRRIAAA